MSEGKHTPGPWRIATGRNISNCIEGQSGRKAHERDDGFRTVATFQDCCASRLSDEADANMQANGLLIAAAPDLLAVAKAYEQWEADLILDGSAWGGMREFPQLTEKLWDRLMELQVMRNAAVAKARGAVT